jgi:ankyrin repeat protein
MSLSSLPAELLDLVYQSADTSTQVFGCLVSRRFYAVASAVLYRANPHAILWGARDGNLEAVKRAVALGASVNIRGPESMAQIARAASPPFDRQLFSRYVHATALHFAAKNGDYAMAKWVLDRGADIDAPSWCLCRCETYPKGPVDEREQELRDNPHPYFRRRWTPLHIAICQGQPSIIRLLIARGASMTVDTWKFKTVNPARPQRLNATALHWAAACGIKSAVKELVTSGKVDVNCVAMDNETPLYYACLASPDPSVVSLLLDLGADPTIISHSFYNKSALMAACDTGNYAAALVLLENNGDRLFGLPNLESFVRVIKRPFQMDFTTVTPESERLEREDAQAELCRKLIDLLMLRITDSDELENILQDFFISASWSQSPTSLTSMKILLEAGPKLKQGSAFTVAALKHALSQNDPNILYRKVKLLFDNGADARLSDDPFLGLESPLTWFLGHIQREIPPYSSPRPGNLGLHQEAYVSQAVHIVRWLLEMGAMDNQQTECSTAGERFRTVIEYRGDSNVMQYAATIMAANFELCQVDGVEIIRDRVRRTEQPAAVHPSPASFYRPARTDALQMDIIQASNSMR